MILKTKYAGSRVIIQHKGKTLTLPQFRISQVGKGDMKQFEVCSVFIDEVLSEAEVDDLFNYYVLADEQISTKPLEELEELFQPFFELVPFQRFVDWFNSLSIVVPSSIPREYLRKIKSEEIRTFTASQYKEFIALIHYCSMLLPLVGNVVAMKRQKTSVMSIVFCYRMIMKYLGEYPAGEKLLGNVERVGRSIATGLVINKKLSSSEAVDYAGATTLFGKMQTHRFENDGSRNIITRFHQILLGKFSKSNVAERLKKIGEEIVSPFEIGVHYQLAQGTLEEYTFITEDPILFANQYGELDEEALKFGMKVVKDAYVCDESISLAAVVLADYIEPRAIYTLDNSVNGVRPIEVLMATAYMLTYKEFPEIAPLFLINPFIENKISLENDINIKMVIPQEDSIYNPIILELYDNLKFKRLIINSKKYDREIIIDQTIKQRIYEYFVWCRERSKMFNEILDA